MSGRRGSGSFGSGRTAGYAIGEDRTSPWLEAIAGIRSDHVPGWAPSPCRLPGPVTRYVQVSVGFSPPRLQRAPPSERQKMCAGQGVRGFFPSGSAVSSIGAIFGILGSWESWESSSRESSSRESCRVTRVHAGHSVRAGQSVQGVSLVEPCYFAQVGTTLPLVE